PISMISPALTGREATRTMLLLTAQPPRSIIRRASLLLIASNSNATASSRRRPPISPLIVPFRIIPLVLPRFRRSLQPNSRWQNRGLSATLCHHDHRQHIRHPPFARPGAALAPRHPSFSAPRRHGRGCHLRQRSRHPSPGTSG